MPDQGTDMARAANEAAMKLAEEQEVTIWLEKKRGELTVRREMHASSAVAAVNGSACLVRECAAMIGISEVKLLAVVATVMTVPAIQEKQKEEP